MESKKTTKKNSIVKPKKLKPQSKGSTSTHGPSLNANANANTRNGNTRQHESISITVTKVPSKRNSIVTIPPPPPPQPSISASLSLIVKPSKSKIVAKKPTLKLMKKKSIQKSKTASAPIPPPPPPPPTAAVMAVLVKEGEKSKYDFHNLQLIQPGKHFQQSKVTLPLGMHARNPLSSSHRSQPAASASAHVEKYEPQDTDTRVQNENLSLHQVRDLNPKSVLEKKDEDDHHKLNQLASFLPSNERLSLDKSAQIYSWIPSPRDAATSGAAVADITDADASESEINFEKPNTMKRETKPWAKYLDPFEYKSTPTYRLDPDLSKSPDFWDKPWSPPEDLKDCFVDSKSVDAFVTHVLVGGSHTECNQQLKKVKYKQNSDDDHDNDEAEYLVLPTKSDPRKHDESDTNSDLSTCGTPSVPCQSPRINISFSYMPMSSRQNLNIWERDSRARKKSAYFPNLFLRGSELADKISKDFTTPEVQEGSSTPKPGPGPAPEETVVENLPEAEAAEAESVVSSNTTTSVESEHSSQGIRDVFLKKFLPSCGQSRQRNEKYSLKEESSSAVNSSETFTKECGNNDYGETLKASSLQLKPVEQLPEQSSNPTDKNICTQQAAQDSKEDSQVSTSTESTDIKIKTKVKKVKSKKTCLPVVPDLQNELDKANKTLQSQPILAYQVNQILNPELTLGQRICAIIDMYNDKSSRLALIHPSCSGSGLEKLEIHDSTNSTSTKETCTNDLNEDNTDTDSTTTTYIISRESRNGSKQRHVHFEDNNNSDRAKDEDSHTSKTNEPYTRSECDIHIQNCAAGSEHVLTNTARSLEEEEQHHDGFHQHSHHPRRRHSNQRSAATGQPRKVSKPIVRKILSKVKDPTS